MLIYMTVGGVLCRVLKFLGKSRLDKHFGWAFSTNFCSLCFTELSGITRCATTSSAQLDSSLPRHSRLIISVLTGLTFAGVLRFVMWFTFMIMGAITGVLTALVLMPYG